MEQQTLNLRKQIVLDLAKRNGLPDGQKAQVVLCIDRSGSMQSLYSNGTVQKIIDRIVPIAMAFDDNSAFEMYVFDNKVIKHPREVTLNNYLNVVNKEMSHYGWGGTNYAPPIKQILKDYVGGEIKPQQNQEVGFFKKLFGTPKQEQVLNTNKPLQTPVYVIFITDGENYDKYEAEIAITEASKYGIFFQFVGIGRESFRFLSKLDNLSGRFIDNANFFKVADPNTETDETLYSLLLNEFPSWVQLAKQKQLIY